MIDAENPLNEHEILTGVDQVAVNYGKPDQKLYDRMSVSQARRFLDRGHFPPGSMGPKIEAALNFLEWGGREVLICSVERAQEAIAGRTGTRIVPD